MLSEDDGRTRWLTEEQAITLLAELPPHLQAMAEFTLETGLRSANVKGLQWSQVDMQRHCCWVLPEDAKSGIAIAVPLSVRALELIKAQIGRHLEYVFTYQPIGAGKQPTPIRDKLSTQAWHKALARAGIVDFRWHDLRHTWASWHIQRGTPLRVLMELGGWSDIAMVQRYAHLSADHLRAYVERDTKLTQSGEEKKESHLTMAIST
jgi:integrase